MPVRHDRWIGSKADEPASGAYSPTVNPSTRQPGDEVAAGAPADVERAVAAAFGAPREWAGRSGGQRSEVLHQVADALEAGTEELIALERAATGQIDSWARMEVEMSVAYFRYCAGIVRAHHSRTIDQGAGVHTHANKRIRSPRPLESVFRGGFFGPDAVPDVGSLGDWIKPTGVKGWGLDSWQLYPNFVILTWARNWYLTYHYWPLGPDKHRFIFSVGFVPPENATERLGQEVTLCTEKDFAIQDATTLEAAQKGINSGARDHSYLCDQEVMIRHSTKSCTATSRRTSARLVGK